MYKLWSQRPLSTCCWFEVQIAGYLSWKDVRRVWCKQGCPAEAEPGGSGSEW